MPTSPGVDDGIRRIPARRPVSETIAKLGEMLKPILTKYHYSLD